MNSESNLLFGVLALRTGLIDAAQFAEARSMLPAQPDLTLPTLLMDRGWLLAEDRVHLEYLLGRSLQRHHGDARACLEAIAPGTLDDLADRTPASMARDDELGDLTPPPPLPDFEGAPTADRSTPVRTSPPAAVVAPAERYATLELHAVGGIGRVWRVRDRALGREVALKELRPESGAHSVMAARFLEEAQITGQLEHPGIVPVYELAWREGSHQPFYTMRFIRGRTLAQAVRDYHQRREDRTADALELRTLLNAFGTVCNTLAYAHARGVIHRDLKGQNVVLGDFGEVIVLDWGLAKLLDRREAPTNLPVVALEGTANRDETLQGQVLGTPAYMAPEQAAGLLDRIDVRTDVYGLGAILYEVLTGQAPFQGTDTEEVLRKVQEETPQRPSRIVPGVSAALEAVCLKALNHNPEDRYATAADLGSDIQRWLADEPVAARRDPWTIRLGRWARRHKPLVSGAGALLLTVLVALAVSTVLIGRQQARAEKNFQMARDVVERFSERFIDAEVLQEPGLQPLRMSLLETAREFHQRFVDENAEDPRRRLDLSRTLLNLAGITAEIDNQGRAFKHIQRAQALLEDLVSRSENDPNARHELAKCFNMQGISLVKLGRLHEAETAYLRAVQEARLLPVGPQQPLEYRRTFALCLNNLSQLYRTQGQIDPAVAAQEEARLVQELLLWEHPRNLRCRSDLAGSYNNLGNLSAARQKPGEAAAWLRLALDLWSSNTQGLTGSLEYQENLALCHSNLAALYVPHGLYLKAWDHSQLAVSLYGHLAKASPSVTGYRHKRARALLTLGNVFLQFWENRPAAEREGHLREACLAYEEARALLDRLVLEQPHVPAYALDRVQALVSLGDLHGYAEQLPEALTWYQKGIDTLNQAGADVRTHPDTRQPLLLASWGRADILARLGRHAEALPDWERAVSLAAGRQRALLRTGRALSLARIGDHARAAEEANGTAAAHPDQKGILVDLVRALALAAAAASRDDRIPVGERQGIADEYIAAALVHLQRAQAAGVLRDAGVRKELRDEKDFAPLRQHEGFRKRMLEAEGVQKKE